MLPNLDTLMFLAEHGTMSRTAARLGISQSAVSKRIQSLEQELRQKLIEPNGRGVLLTPFAVRLIERAKPLYIELKEALSEEIAESTGELVIAFSGALLLSWGKSILSRIRKANPGIAFTINAHRSPIAIARVRSGDCMIAIVHGTSELTPDLTAKIVAHEEIIIVPSGLKPFKLPVAEPLQLLTVESHSETWSVMERKLRQFSRRRNVEIIPINRMQNFLSVTQLARAGFAHGLTPIGVPLAVGIPEKKLFHFPDSGMFIPVSLVGRGTTLERSIVKRFHDSLREILGTEPNMGLRMTVASQTKGKLSL